MITAENPTVIPPPPPPLAPAEPPYSLRRIVLGLILVVAVFDVCFWGVNGMGLSVAVFVPFLAGVILANRENSWRRSTAFIGVLLAGACLAAAIETGTTNTLVLLILVIALAGDSYYEQGEAWSRWFTQCLALAFAPGRVFWLGARVLEVFFGQATGSAARIVAGLLLAIPALVLALVFGSLLASGNAVFGAWAGNFFSWFWKEIANLFNFERIILWGFVAFIALPLLRPARFVAGWWSWIPKLPRLPELVPTNGAIFSSTLILVVLNFLFAVANVADAMFLWSGAPLPAGVEYKAYVHQGVDTLIFTVNLTAIVLTAIFQQHIAVARNASLKVLALVWVAQNIFLIASCTLRIRGYIDESQLTVLRLSCLIFLALVAAGFAFLTVKILHEHSIAWLMGRCLVAVFVTFYITQFLDLSGYAMNYNMARMAREPSYRIDPWKLYEAGPAGWPAARRVHELDPSIAVLNADSSKGPVTTDQVSLAKFDAKHWREFSLRAYWNSWALDDKK